jgi:hypothetical protein
MTASLRSTSASSAGTLAGSTVSARARASWFRFMLRTTLSSWPRHTSWLAYIACMRPFAWPRLTMPTVAPTTNSKPSSAITKIRRVLMVIFLNMAASMRTEGNWIIETDLVIRK